MNGYTIGSYKLPDSTNDRIKQLEAENARLRQQLQSLVEAVNSFSSRFEPWIQKQDDKAQTISALKFGDEFYKLKELAVQSAQETEEKLICRWTRYVDDEPWTTDCDNLFEFNVDGPRENQFKYCPYCGKEIEAQP